MSEEFVPRRYACKQWPFLRLGGTKDASVKFEAGFCTAHSPEEAAIIENNSAFGIHIFPIKDWKPVTVPSRAGQVEALIEKDIQEALAAKQPRVRRGGIGTR